MTSFTDKILIQGIGNPLRGDDGIAPSIIFELQNDLQKGRIQNSLTEIEWVYQLQIEDAEKWSRFDEVILLDAHLHQTDDLHYTLLPNAAQSKVHIGSHHSSPEMIFELCSKLFDRRPKVWVISLKGQDFNPHEGLSLKGKQSAELGRQKILERLSQNCSNLP